MSAVTYYIPKKLFTGILKFVFFLLDFGKPIDRLLFYFTVWKKFKKWRCYHVSIEILFLISHDLVLFLHVC